MSRNQRYVVALLALLAAMAVAGVVGYWPFSIALGLLWGYWAPGFVSGDSW